MRRLQGETRLNEERLLLTELPEMHIELWIMRTLYRQYALSRVAFQLRDKINWARERSEKRLLAEAERQREQEAEDACAPWSRGGGAEGRRQ